jgi:thiamine biosynthesis protein ThiI
VLSVIAHYQEIALKGKNRPWFLNRLVRNLRFGLSDLDVPEIRTPMGRLEIILGNEAAWPEVRERLTRMFGLANFSLARRVPLHSAVRDLTQGNAVDLAVIADALVKDLPTESVESFRIAVRRADKRFSIPSPEVERLLGRRVQDARGWKVDLSNPAMKIGIELLPKEAFYYFGKLPGPGGLPMGTAGKVAALLSGGIDSPVAAWRMMKRGCTTTLIHFHSYPFLSRTSQDKARELAKILTQYQFRSHLYLVPFGELQRQVTLSVAGPLRVVIYRRMMFRIADRLARMRGAHALVTGEVVGQVASQTIDNMTAIDSASSLPVFRPLIGMDKDEITAQAEKLGTYKTSIVPDEDCCTLFTPRHPATSARRHQIEEAERTLPIPDLVQAAISAAVLERLQFPTGRSESDRIEVSEVSPWLQ